MRNIVYEIYDPITGKKYIGSKMNYQGDGTYYGSSCNEEMIKIKKERPETLQITILHDNVSKEDLLYLEYKEQKKNNVILNDMYWNLSYCGRRISGSFSGAKDKIWIYKDNRSKMVNEDQLDIFLNDNWKIGRTQNTNKKFCINKDGRHKRVEKENIAYYLSLGWNKGNLPRNLGKIRINKGNSEKLISKEHLDSFLENGWNIGVKANRYSPKDTIWISKDDKTKMIKLDELNQYIHDGWERKRNNKKFRNTLWVNKDNNVKRIKNIEIDLYLQNGWKRGMK